MVELLRQVTYEYAFVIGHTPPLNCISFLPPPFTLNLYHLCCGRFDTSPTTRAMMERDMLVRKFQKENLDDLFAVIRQNPWGMQCLARFAEEQRMGGEVGFFMEVKGEILSSAGWQAGRSRSWEGVSKCHGGRNFK